MYQYRFIVSVSLMPDSGAAVSFGQRLCAISADHTCFATGLSDHLSHVATGGDLDSTVYGFCLV